MIDLYLMRRIVGTSKDKIFTDGLSALLDGQTGNLTDEESQEDEVKCQDYFTDEAQLLKIMGAGSDEPSIILKYQNEKIKVNDLDVTEVKRISGDHEFRLEIVKYFSFIWTKKRTTHF